MPKRKTPEHDREVRGIKKRTGYNRVYFRTDERARRSKTERKACLAIHIGTLLKVIVRGAGSDVRIWVGARITYPRPPAHREYCELPGF